MSDEPPDCNECVCVYDKAVLGWKVVQCTRACVRACVSVQKSGIACLEI